MLYNMKNNSRYEMLSGRKFTMCLPLYISLLPEFYLINATAAFHFYFKL